MILEVGLYDGNSKRNRNIFQISLTINSKYTTLHNRATMYATLCAVKMTDGI